MKEVKIVIGANYGDCGKGLMTRYFANEKENSFPIIILHSGTAQRGHTVDYDETHRHVFHHFGAGAGDGLPTFFAKTFLIHPMEFHREHMEGIDKDELGRLMSKCFCDPDAKVITPFDMLVDHATEEYIAKQKGHREYGSCGYGSWCAVEDRFPMGRTAYSIKDFSEALFKEQVPVLMNNIWRDCLCVLRKRGVSLEETSYGKTLFDDIFRDCLISRFTADLHYFCENVECITFDSLWEKFDSFIFEGSQGLGLDKNVENEWHTTSNTGLTNPIAMLDDKDFKAEVCYVTRSYITRHGKGPIEFPASKKEINAEMFDRTNIPNKFQGTLTYGFFEEEAMCNRILKDCNPILDDSRYTTISLAVTHVNEFPYTGNIPAKYISDNPYTVKRMY